MIQNEEKKSFDVKILLMGDSNVGKTTLLTKYITGDFNLNLDATLSGINLFRKNFTKKSKNEENSNYFINIWDITGSDNYLNFVSLISDPIHSVIIQTNADDTKIESSLKKWLDNIKKFSKFNFKKYLIISTRNNLPLDKVVLRNLVLDYDLNNYFVIDAKNTQQVNSSFENIFNEVITTHNLIQISIFLFKQYKKLELEIFNSRSWFQRLK